MTLRSYGYDEMTAAPAERAPDTQELLRPRLQSFWLLVVVGLALHNVEEGLLGLTGWVASHPWMPGRGMHGEQAQFVLALAMVTAVVLAIAVVAVMRRTRWSAGALTAVAWAFIINASSHLVLSLTSWSVMPGTVSGVLVLLPLGLLIVHTLPSTRWSTMSVIGTTIAAVGLVMGSLVLAASLTSVFGSP